MLGKAGWVGRFFPEMPVHTSNATAVVPAEQSWMEEIRERAWKSGSCAKAGGWGVMIYDSRQR